MVYNARMANKEVSVSNISESLESSKFLYDLSDMLFLPIGDRDLPVKLLMDENILRAMRLPRFESIAVLPPDPEAIFDFLSVQFQKEHGVAIRVIGNQFGSLGGYPGILPVSFEEAVNSFVQEDAMLWMVTKRTKEEKILPKGSIIAETEETITTITYDTGEGLVTKTTSSEKSE